MATAVSIHVDPEFKSLIPPLMPEEYRQLEANLLADGCRDPLVVWAGHDVLLDGHNRLEICQKHGIEYRTVDHTLPDRAAAKEWVIRNQFGRRNLSAYQRAELALRLEPLIAAKAKEKQRQHGGTAPGKSLSQKSDEVNTKRELARAAGVSHDTIHKAKVIADRAPEPVKESLRRGETSINAEYKAIQATDKRIQKQATAKRIEAEPAPQPKGPFRVIAIDPPWRYESRVEDDSHRGRNQYPDMSIEDICALPVADLAHADCALFLWTTNAFMHDAYHCLEAWGFTPKTILTWDKVNLGLGDWLRNVTEHCIMAVRGKPVISLTNQTTIIREKRREHSRKPEAFYALVESLCPGSKLEMFARQQRDGWQAWGAEAEKFNVV